MALFPWTIKRFGLQKDHSVNHKVLTLSKKIIYFEINFVDYKTKIINVLNKVQMINVDYKQFAILIIPDPIFIMFVQLSQIIQANRVFKISSSFFDLPN